MSIVQSLVDGLRKFLTVTDDTSLALGNLLKNRLLSNLDFYFDKYVSDEQRKAILVRKENLL